MSKDNARSTKGYKNAAAYVALMLCMNSAIFNLLGDEWN